MNKWISILTYAAISSSLFANMEVKSNYHVPSKDIDPKYTNFEVKDAKAINFGESDSEQMYLKYSIPQELTRGSHLQVFISTNIPRDIIHNPKNTFPMRGIMAKGPCTWDKEDAQNHFAPCKNDGVVKARCQIQSATETTPRQIVCNVNYPTIAEIVGDGDEENIDTLDEKALALNKVAKIFGHEAIGILTIPLSDPYITP